MTPGGWILLVSVALALGLGTYRLLSDGRFRGTHRIRRPDDEVAPVVEVRAQRASKPPVVPSDQLGERATLVQFSSAFCAPCRATRRVLADVAAAVPGVRHVELDAEQHLDLVRRVGVTRTPTTLVLDHAGHEVTRAAGAPRKEHVLAVLAGIEAS
ncbi:TlpA family protein disulfide reductase [Nocardioides sp.]|uniref:TlpA family protein disulfide reductase n=1 Tax=Nocardioides sp. TaxID=35761 RepID=UPI002ED4815A